jgi:hypothetical protein
METPEQRRLTFGERSNPDVSFMSYSCNKPFLRADFGGANTAQKIVIAGKCRGAEAVADAEQVEGVPLQRGGRGDDLEAGLNGCLS